MYNEKLIGVNRLYVIVCEPDMCVCILTKLAMLRTYAAMYMAIRVLKHNNAAKKTAS